MKYKALIFDLDGTAIPNRSDGMPSNRLINVVSQLKQKMKVCAATGRPFFNSKHILKALGILDPCIISGGAQIIDPVTEKTLWEKLLSMDQVQQIMQKVSSYEYPVFFSDDKKSVPANKKIATGPERIVYIEEVEKEDCDTIIEKLKEIKNTKAYFVYSWSKNRFDIHVTHKGATKRHALQILLDILDISSEDIIAAGDGNNDLALFEVAKYKIAMDNGQPELKAKADIIAPSVENDGLAVVLEDINLTK